MNAMYTRIQILSLITSVVILGALPPMSFARVEWTQITEMPTARVGLSTRVVDGKIYVIGGRTNPRSGGSSVSTVEEYDPATNQWTTKASMLSNRYDFATCVVDGKIYAVGGFPGGGGASTRIVEMYDPATDTWTRKADLPTMRATLAAGVVAGKIYTIGGGDSSIVEVYDPVTDVWTRGADMPTRRHPSVSVVDNQIYAIGGLGVGPRWPALSVVEQYDPATDTWTRKTDMPTPRSGFSTTVIYGKIYAIGGRSSDGTDLSLTPALDIEVYDPATDAWAKGLAMTGRRIGASACAVDRILYVFGGFQEFSANAFRAVEALDLNPVVDFNADGAVDIDDLLRLIDSWGLNDPLTDIGPPPFGDEMVDAADLEVLMGYWGQQVDDPTLVAHWALDEAEGTVALDSAGQNDAYLMGGPVWLPTGGRVNGAIELDGVDDVAIAASVPKRADWPFSVLAWIKSAAAGRTLISDPGGADWLQTEPLSGYLMTELTGSGRSHGPLVSQTVITDGEWHRIGFVWDGLNRRLYADSAVAAQDMQGGSLGNAIAGLHIGAGKAMAPETYWSGLVDDVRIYNRAVAP